MYSLDSIDLRCIYTTIDCGIDKLTLHIICFYSRRKYSGKLRPFLHFFPSQSEESGRSFEVVCVSQGAYFKPRCLAAPVLLRRVSQSIAERPRAAAFFLLPLVSTGKTYLYPFYSPRETRTLLQSNTLYTCARHIQITSRLSNPLFHSTFLLYQLCAYLPRFSIYLFC